MAFSETDGINLETVHVPEEKENEEILQDQVKQRRNGEKLAMQENRTREIEEADAELNKQLENNRPDSPRNSRAMA